MGPPSLAYSVAVGSVAKDARKNIQAPVSVSIWHRRDGSSRYMGRRLMSGALTTMRLGLRPEKHHGAIDGNMVASSRLMNLPGAPPPDEATSAEAALEQLRQQNAELIEAVAARDNFIAVAAHELRNPMTPIVGQIDLLLANLQAGRYSSVQVEHRVRRIRRAMNHFIKRAGTLLDVSRITNGRFHLSSAPCDLSDLVREMVETFTEMARYSGCSIGIEVPESLAGACDRLALEQVLENLISNAIKYAPSGPVTVSAEALGSLVRFKVRDHGPGISAGDRARIFERFERAVGTSERHSGFGVGLWVVGQLVAAMEGTIVVDDAEGGGSVFTVTLPRYLEAKHP
jgi:two-component system, OmpR family, sensor kinase